MREMRGWQMQALIRDKSTAFWPGSIFPKKAVSEAPVEPDPTPPDRLQAAMELRVGVCVRLFTPVRVSSLAPVAGCEAQIPTRERALLCFLRALFAPNGCARRRKSKICAALGALNSMHHDRIRPRHSGSQAYLARRQPKRVWSLHCR